MQENIQLPNLTVVPKDNAGEHTAAKSDCILVLKANAVLGNRKWESTKTRFKTGENNIWQNANWLGESTRLIKESFRATMWIGDKRNDKPIRNIS